MSHCMVIVLSLLSGSRVFCLLPMVCVSFLSASDGLLILWIYFPISQGSYKIKLQFLGEEGEQLACANINFSIIWSASVAETLESFNPIELHKNLARKAPVAHT